MLGYSVKILALARSVNVSEARLYVHNYIAHMNRFLSFSPFMMTACKLVIDNYKGLYNANIWMSTALIGHFWQRHHNDNISNRPQQHLACNFNRNNWMIKLCQASSECLEYIIILCESREMHIPGQA